MEKSKHMQEGNMFCLEVRSSEGYNSVAIKKIAVHLHLAFQIQHGYQFRLCNFKVCKEK